LKLIVNRYEKSERVSQLGQAMVFSQTERSVFGCNRLWTYKYVQEFNTKGMSKPRAYGIIWHSWLEYLLFRFGSNLQFDRVKKEMDCGVHMKFISDELSKYDLNDYEYEDFHQEIQQRMANSTEGWVASWNKHISGKYTLIAIEQELIAPVFDLQGDHFVSNERFIEEEIKGVKQYRLAKVGEIHDSFEMQMPWYKIGKADAILMDNDNGYLWIIDHKTTSSLSTYRNKLSYDLQLPSYCRLLQYELEHGCFSSLKCERVAGYLWDICSSKIPNPPKPLKSGKLSTARLGPSWQFKKAVIENDLDFSDYEEHYRECKEQKDSDYFGIEYGWITEEDIERTTVEDYAVAKKLSEKRNELVRINPHSKRQFDFASLRHPLCDRWGKCQFGANCIANTPLEVIQYPQLPTMRWVINNQT